MEGPGLTEENTQDQHTVRGTAPPFFMRSLRPPPPLAHCEISLTPVAEIAPTPLTIERKPPEPMCATADAAATWAARYYVWRG